MLPLSIPSPSAAWQSFDVTDWFNSTFGTNLTFNVSYVDTDISNREAAYLRPSFSKGQDGTGNIADGTVVVSLTAAF